MSAALFQPLPSSLIFSMFSSRDRLTQDAHFLRHTSPLALAPSARMAAGPRTFSTETNLNKPASPTGVCTGKPELATDDC